MVHGQVRPIQTNRSCAFPHNDEEVVLAQDEPILVGECVRSPEGLRRVS